MSSWTKVRVLLGNVPLDWAMYIETFNQYGVVGTEQKDSPVALEGYLDESRATPALLDELKSSFLKQGAEDVTFELVAEDNWAEAWKQFFHAKEIGNRFVICPSWETLDFNESKLVIVLDPGQAFGTGEHSTTKMCLELLETIELVGKRVADIGCGSGILSVASGLLGADRVIGVDTEHISVLSTAENAKRNLTNVEVFEGKGFEPIPADQKFDVIVSNIVSPVILSIISGVKQHLEVGGHWLVSGIIESNWSHVLSSISAAGFKCLAQKQEGEWIAATFCH